MKYSFLYILIVLLAFSCSKNDASDGGSPTDGSSSGKSGSMARFTVADGNLYLLENSNIRSYSLEEPSSPSLISSIEVADDIETIFPFDDKLFVGSQTGMYIFGSENGQLNYLSRFEHIRSCDPVVADGDYAFITLNSASTSCWNSTNELQVVDISDIYNPQFIKSYQLTEPHGLGIDQDLLFVCDNGLKVYDRNDVNDLQRIAYFTDIKPYDVIPYDSLLLVTAEEGLSFYQYENKSIKLLSKIQTGSH